MPRAGRLLIANLPHHIVQRGHNRRPVFLRDGDRRAYLDTLQEFREKFGFRLYGYCLMTNHVHLIVCPGDDPEALSRLMKRLAGRHTRRVNRLEHRTGTSWDGRFKSSPIDTDSYLLACSRYVELNPVRAGIVARPESYEWSSFRALTGRAPADRVDPSPCYLALAATVEERQRRYGEFVASGIEERELKFLRDAVQRNQLTGPRSFVREIEQRLGRRIVVRPRGRPNGNPNGDDPNGDRSIY